MASGRPEPDLGTLPAEEPSGEGSPSLADRVLGLERRLLVALAIAVLVVIVGYAWARPDLANPQDRRMVLLGLVSLLSLLAVTGLGLLVPTISQIREGFQRRDAARERLVEEANEHAERLEAYSQELERRNEDLRRFAYVVAHDLREPARTVSTHARLAQRRADGDLDPDVHDRLESAVTAAQHLDALLGDLLAYVTLDQHVGELGPVDLDEAVEEALMRLDTGEVETHAEIVVEELPTVRGHRAPLVRLFEELIGNALKFSGEDGPPHVAIRCEERGDDWVLEVEDDGIGMEPEYADRVLSMFERLHRHEEIPGTGAGLAICRRVAELHGGDIELTTTPGEGLTVRVELPQDAAEIPATGEQPFDVDLPANAPSE